jgi:site-specific DNA-adenine methylase
MAGIVKPNLSVTALAPWFGSARQQAAAIARQIGSVEWLGIPFCGGCSEVPWVRARSICCSDVHRHIYNLGWVISRNADEMLASVEGVLFHPDTLAEARKFIASIDGNPLEEMTDVSLRIAWAAAYYVNCWMSRSHAGAKDEFKQPLGVRYTASGGSSIARWRGAVEGIKEWERILRNRVEFCCVGWEEFLLKKFRDREGHALYLDPPWLIGGEAYAHRMTPENHRRMLSLVCARTTDRTRVVIRHCDHPLYRELLRERDGWEWIKQGSRNAGNNEVDEWLIVRGKLGFSLVA